jgi:hypothetical protein
MLSRASLQQTWARRRLATLAVLVWAVVSCASVAATVVVFGPQTYQRGAGTPTNVTQTFRVDHPAAQYTLRVTNNGVTSAVITLNGVRIIGPSDLHNRFEERGHGDHSADDDDDQDDDDVPPNIDRPVTLHDGTNQLDVLLQGVPGRSLTVEIFTTATTTDTTPPTITATASPAPNANGWNNGNVTVTFACADADSGVKTCPAPVVVSTEGANQSISGTAVDNAGNTATATVHVSLDKTAPAVIATVSAAPNGNGWYNAPVTVHFTCTDGGSGIATCPADQTTSGEGAAITVTGSATDVAGNTASASAGPLHIDFTPPTIAAVLTPTPNGNGWNNTPVTVHFVCADNGAGVASCPLDQTVATDGSNQIVSGSVTDNAGNTASTTATVNLDSAPPVITLLTPSDNLNSFVASITATGSVVDALSGIASVVCNGAPASVIGGDISCGATLAPGANSFVATAVDLAGNSASASLSLNYTRIPSITITAPANLSYLNISPTTVTGTVDDPTATIAINSIPAVLDGSGGFSLALPLAEGPNVVTASATNANGGSSTASIQVTLDTTPPHVTITSPADQFVTADASINVAGNINDIVVGTVNDTQAQVTVNGGPAQVANRMFLAANVPLSVGPNIISAVGRDRVGNEATTQITVVRQPAPVTQHIALVSGNNQTGAIGSALPLPLVVSLTDVGGAPIPNATVIFKVTQNDGLVTSAGAGPSPTAIVKSGGDGRAQVTWNLGHRSGAGGNSVQAYSVGFDGTAVFTATGTQGPAGKIVVDTGNDQVGAIDAPLPKPFIAVVIDDGNNRLGGVPVTFTVTAGGGSFEGQPSFTVNSDSDGRAAATLTLGDQEGNANNVVEATFPTNFGFPAAFAASGRAPGNPNNTVITGVVLDNSNAPIPGVLVRAVLTNEMHANAAAVDSAVASQTDAQGLFDIAGAPVGLVKLLVDGSTAQLPGQYPNLEYDIVTVAGQNNTVGQPIYLLPINTNNQLCVTATTGGGTLTMPDAPGFSLTFGPGQVTFPGGSKEGCVSVTVVHGDKVPMVPGFGQQPRFIVTIQPAGAVFNPPAPMTIPNVDGLRPREVTEMYSFDHDIGSFVAIGIGTVSDDGSVIRTNQGVGVLKAGWHCGGNPSPTGTAANCPTCQKCTGTTCVPDNGASCDDGKFCTSADGKAPGADKCDNGSCSGKKIEGESKIKFTADPDTIIKIKEAIEKVSNIASTATAWMPCWVGSVSPDVSLSEEEGKYCCESDQKMEDGHKFSGGGGLKISAGCFVGLSSLAPELPAKLIQALGIQGSASLSVKVDVSDVLDACKDPQWDEQGNLGFSLSINIVIVKAGDIIGVKFEGPKGEAKVGFKGENFFSNFQWTGSACIDGEVKMVVEEFGFGFEVKLFSLFDKICWGGS